MKDVDKEIEFLKHLSEFYNFEQNHILADYLPRIIFIATLDVTVSLAFLHFGYFFLGTLVFAIGMLEMIRRSLDLKQEREKVVDKRLKINGEIFQRYEKLGVNVRKLSQI